jgi:hypothetical protein
MLFLKSAQVIVLVFCACAVTGTDHPSPYRLPCECQRASGPLQFVPLKNGAAQRLRGLPGWLPESCGKWSARSSIFQTTKSQQSKTSEGKLPADGMINPVEFVQCNHGSQNLNALESEQIQRQFDVLMIKSAG